MCDWCFPPTETWPDNLLVHSTTSLNRLVSFHENMPYILYTDLCVWFGACAFILKCGSQRCNVEEGGMDPGGQPAGAASARSGAAVFICWQLREVEALLTRGFKCTSCHHTWKTSSLHEKPAVHLGEQQAKEDTKLAFRLSTTED